MPDWKVDAEGIHVKTRQELIDKYTEDYKQIYGSDINLDPSTPDAQMMNIRIQEILDLQELIVSVFNSFDPDQARGRVLDQRIAINGLRRQAGTYTITPIQIETDRAVTLYGLDQTAEDVYTVADDAGNNWLLQTTQFISNAGTYNLNFRAENSGAVLTTPNTITVPVSIVIGVVGINNPSPASIIGLNEEMDADVKERRRRSVSMPSQGFRDGLEAALEDIPGIVFAKVYENKTSSEVNGIPPHGIWVIVEGAYDSEAVANAIYIKRNLGCDMRGEISHEVIQRDGSPFIVQWDEVVAQEVFIAFTVEPIDGVSEIDTEGLAEYIVENYRPGVHETLNVNRLSTIAQEFDSNILVTDAGFSLTESDYSNTLTPSELNKRFALSVERIDINE